MPNYGKGRNYCCHVNISFERYLLILIDLFNRQPSKGKLECENFKWIRAQFFLCSICTYVPNLLAQKSHLETIINRVNVRNLRSTYRSASTFKPRSILFKEKNTKSANFFFGVIITVLTAVCVGHFE